MGYAIELAARECQERAPVALVGVGQVGNGEKVVVTAAIGADVQNLVAIKAATS